MKKAICLILITLLFLPRHKAQYFDSDARLWLYLKLNRKIVKKLNAQLTIQNRFNNNITQYEQLTFSGELSYKLNNIFRLTGGYATGKDRRKDLNFNNRSQLFGGFSARYRLGKLQFVYRNLLQASFKNFFTAEDGGITRVVERNKLSISYEWNQEMECYVLAELNTVLYPADNWYLGRERYAFGLVRKLSKSSSIETYFMLQNRFSYSGPPRRDFIYGFTFNHDF